MDLIFNELSLYHKVDSTFKAQELIKNLLLTCKEANKFNFKHLRVNINFFQLKLTKDYSLNDWLNDPSVRGDYKTLLLGLKRYPFIAEGDENIENYYYLNMPEVQELHMQVTEGLAVAFLYNTLSISFKTREFWNRTQIELFEKTNKEIRVTVKHISWRDHVEYHREWIESNRPVELIETDIIPEKKTVHLRDDHGKDTLKDFSNKLINSPYVVKIINSLPFNPKEKDFIKNITPCGKIEIVLTWTDAGFGLIAQTTGRNFQETKKIADILTKTYHKNTT
ncbi:MAG TPA: hypothetical protein VJL89_13005 [Thermodesulfovibrionia bacterium]|nr:hypothetical protein [Thermodesulfovibrionia bacterium]